LLKNKPAPAARRVELAPGDTVMVTTGKDRGKTGEVLRVLPRQGRIVVQGVNVMRRHTKAGQSVGGNRVIQGGVVDFEAPLEYSNVMLVCPSCHKPTRIRHVVLEDGKRAIQCVHCDQPYERVRRTEVQ
jgi:large subunit ribosomal protein L24